MSQTTVNKSSSIPNSSSNISTERAIAPPSEDDRSPLVSAAVSPEATVLPHTFLHPPVTTDHSPHVSVMAVHGSGAPQPSGQLPWMTAGHPRKTHSNAPQHLHGFGKLNTGLEPIADDGAADLQPHTPLAFDTAGARQNHRVIAIDFDEVLCESMSYACHVLNTKHGENVTPDDMHSYVFFQNKGWGTPAQSIRRARAIDAIPANWPAIPGLLQALQALKSLGHPLHIITARAATVSAHIDAWLADKGIKVGDGPDALIAAVWYAGMYVQKGEDKSEDWAENLSTASGIERERQLDEQVRDHFLKMKKSSHGSKKVDIMRAIDARLLIDDSIDNCFAAAKADPPIPCILFGAYAWNKAHSACGSAVELMSFAERQDAGLELQQRAVETDEHVQRASTWHGVVDLVKAWDAKAGSWDE